LGDNHLQTANQKKLFIIWGLLVLAAFVLSLRVGRFPVEVGDIMAIFLNGDVSPMTRNVFLTLRLPRVGMALLAGAGLGFAGSVFQMVFKNPLAAPDIIGATSGANLGAALAIILFGQSVAVMAFSAFAGSMLVVFAVVALARINRGNSTVTYILAGIVMKAVSDALIMLMKFFADHERQLAAIEFWAMGSLSSITASRLAAVLPFFLIGFIGLIFARRHIAVLGLEDDESRSLGVPVKQVRVVVLGLASLTVAAVICLTGLIAFVGLIAPHVARLAIKRVSFAWCMLSALTGALILLAADSFARGLSNIEIPISILTTFIGVPMLLYFMYNRKAGRV
jgi:iron complex transport system permease protein